MSNVLPQGWEENKLSFLVDIIGGGTPKTYIEEYWNGDIPWLSVKDFNNDNRKVYKTEKTITELGLNKSSTRLLQKDELIISARGTVGELAQIPFPMAFNQSCYGLRGKKDKLDNTFLYYGLKNILSDIRNNTHGSVFSTITKQTFDTLSIKFPSDINEQKRIADILSAFDDKIELNNQMNQTLEDMATTLFANSLLDKKTFSATTLGELVEIKYGKDHKHLEDGNMPLYGSGGIMRYVNNFLYDKESILIPRKGTLGNLFYIQKPFWTVDTIFYTEINTSKVIPIYLYYVLKRFDLANLNVGSAVPSLTKQALNALKLEIPNISIQKKVSDTLTSLHNKILENIEQNQTLKQQRDTLLPKLMSGEIRV